MEALKANNRRPGEENPAASDGAASTTPIASRSAAILAELKIKCAVEPETGAFPTGPRPSPPSSESTKSSDSPKTSTQTSSERSSPSVQTVAGLSQMKIQEETNSPVIRNGEGGKKVSLAANYVRLEVEKGKGVFEYEVKFSPPVNSKNKRLKCLNQHSNIIEPSKTFDGVVLGLHSQLPESKTVLQSEHPDDGSPVFVTITLKWHKKMGVRNCKEKVKAKEICDICGDSVNAGKMPVHMNRVHANVKNVPSTYCDKKIRIEGEAKLCGNKHENENNGAVKYTCNICEYKAKDIWKLNRHKKTHVECEDKDNAIFKLACQNCKYKTDDKWKLERHMKTHVGYENKDNAVFKYACRNCKYKTDDKWKLVRHTETHLEYEKKDNATFKFSCDTCEFENNDKWKLDRHTETHEKKENVIFKYTCDMCGYKSNDEWKMGRHNQTRHMKIKPYLCPICEVKSGTKSNLKTHIQKVHKADSSSISQLEELYPKMYNDSESEKDWITDPLFKNLMVLAKQSNRKRKRIVEPSVIIDGNDTVTKKKMKLFSLKSQNIDPFPMVDEINTSENPEETKLVMKKLKAVVKKLPPFVNMEPEGDSENSSDQNQNVDAAKEDQDEIVTLTLSVNQVNEINRDILTVPALLLNKDVIGSEITQEDVTASPTSHENPVDEKNKDIVTKSPPLPKSHEIVTGIPTRVIKYVNKVPDESTKVDNESDVEEIPRRNENVLITHFSIERIISSNCGCHSYKE